MARRPMKPGYAIPERRSLADIAKEEAIRGGIRAGYGLLDAAAITPLKTAMGAEGSIGRNLLSDEVRAMKRQEAESMAAQRVAPYYQAQQQTQQRGMQEAGQTQRTGMTQAGAMDRQKLQEGSDIVQLQMKLQSQMQDRDKQLQFKEWLARFKRSGAAKKNSRLQVLLKTRKELFDSEGYNPAVIAPLDAQILQAIGADPAAAEAASKMPLQATPKAQVGVEKEKLKIDQKQRDADAKVKAEEAKFERRKELEAYKASLKTGKVQSPDRLISLRTGLIKTITEFGLEPGDDGYAALMAEANALQEEIDKRQDEAMRNQAGVPVFESSDEIPTVRTSDLLNQ